MPLAHNHASELRAETASPVSVDTACDARASRLGSGGGQVAAVRGEEPLEDRAMTLDGLEPPAGVF